MAREIDKIINDIKKLDFSKNYLNLKITLETYLALKKCLNDENIAIDDEFKKIFARFYGFQRVSPEWREMYFAKLRKCKEDKIIELADKELAKELIDPKSGNIQFSFVTKLMNIRKEDNPIYDSMVLKAFGLYLPDINKDEKDDRETIKQKRLTNYANLYKYIKDVYRSLIESDECKEKIKEFRAIFGCEDKQYISDMRILDMIVWQIGKNMMATEAEAKKQQKESENK